jgi:predicted ATPase/class 3 adenylate cyclase
LTQLPVGTLTFLFSDIEGSTRRWEQHPEAMRLAVARHDELLRRAIESEGGQVFKTVGDAFCAVFVEPADAVESALAVQRSVLAESWGELEPFRVRLALHTGVAELRDDDYFGSPLNRVARLLSTAHGGQVVLSASTTELTRDALPGGAALRDLGEHRLKDLARPERVYQLTCEGLPTEHPPLRSLDPARHNLPTQATPLVGRERELASASDRLLRPEVRLLTLTGPGGVGKTRLGLQLAAEVIEHFPDGVFFVPLAPLSDSALVVPAIARALGVQDTGQGAVFSMLKEALTERRILLVLDNFEQVTAAAEHLAALLSACPLLKTVVTSRSLLRVYGEHEHPVPPLSLPERRPHGPAPTPESLSQYEAVHLFIARARAVRPDFAVTSENAPALAEICHRLDGLPLAIELAAARVRLLPLEAILARLEHSLSLLTAGARDLPARQQTLRGAIAWSYDLLDEDEQRLFSRLAVFAGGFTVEAAEALAGDGAVDVLDGISSLLDKSLLRQDEQAGQSRFTMLQTIREYALERLESSGEAPAIRQRQAEYFLELVMRGAPTVFTADQLTWLRWLQVEQDNLRAALGWLKESGDSEAELRLAGGLWGFWHFGSFVREGRDWLEDVLARAGNAATPARAKALLAVGALAWLQSDYPAAVAHLTASERLFRELGSQHGVALAQSHLAQALELDGDSGRAQTLFAEAEATLWELDDRWGLATLTLFRAHAAFRAEQYTKARLLGERSLDAFRKIGGPLNLSMPLNLLGSLAMQRGDFTTARALLDESLAIRRDLHDRWECGHLLNTLGDLSRLEGDLVAASTAYEESRRLFRAVGSLSGLAVVLHNLGLVALAAGDLEGATDLLTHSLEHFRELKDSRGEAECLAGLGGVAASEGQPERAARLFGAAEARLQALGVQLWFANRAIHAEWVKQVRADLGPETYATLNAEGRKRGALAAEAA